jgi:hypothetical protein
MTLEGFAFPTQLTGEMTATACQIVRHFAVPQGLQEDVAHVS